ncbi:MAG: hypothetical protein GY769_13785 [bacterium]|nr:hypothetical protein [bacterium]
MNDEAQTPEVRTPFEPEPADLGGCGKPVVIGCLAVLVLLAIGFVVFLAKARNMLDWALLQYQTAVVANLAEEVTVEERERLVSAFEDARAAIRENRMEPSALQKLQRFMSSPPKPDQPITPDTVRELSEVLESLAGAPVEFPEASPLGAPEPGTTASAHHAVV